MVDGQIPEAGPSKFCVLNSQENFRASKPAWSPQLSESIDQLLNRIQFASISRWPLIHIAPLFDESRQRYLCGPSNALFAIFAQTQLSSRALAMLQAQPSTPS
jgi:hypothetical protein